MVEISAVPALSDNYVWLIHGRDNARVAIVDPGEAKPVIAALEEQGLEPAAILVTHRHWDHVNGIKGLLKRYDLPVYGPGDEPVPERTQALGDGDRVTLDELGLSFDVIAIPGHTLGHIAYAGHGLLFAGDTLFSGGCGRMFEGHPEQMLASLDRLAALPDDTRLYCGHEYTLKNLSFCRAVEPDNPAIDEFVERARQRLDDGRPSLPTTLAEEKRFNVFLRCREANVARAVSEHQGRATEAPAEVFAGLRAWKDTF